MSYIDHSLAASEALIYRARFPWFYQVEAWLLLAAAAVCGFILHANGFEWPFSAGVMAVGVVAFLTVMLPIWTTEIAVTTQRFIYKRGWLRRTTQELQLRAIEEVNLEQDLLGRLLNYGHLELRGTGVDDIRLPALADPIGLRKALQDGMAAATQARPPAVGVVDVSEAAPPAA